MDRFDLGKQQKWLLIFNSTTLFLLGAAFQKQEVIFLKILIVILAAVNITSLKCWIENIIETEKFETKVKEILRAGKVIDEMNKMYKEKNEEKTAQNNF